MLQLREVLSDMASEGLNQGSVLKPDFFDDLAWRQAMNVIPVIHGKTLVALALFAIAFAATASTLPAAPPSVDFDCIPVVECMDVDLLRLGPMGSNRLVLLSSGVQARERLVEARFQVSVLINAAHPLDIEELRVTVTSPGRWLRVLDYSPKTELFSSFVGPIHVTEATTDSRSFQAGASGIAPVASASASLSDQRSETKVYNRVPDKELHVASGTLEGGSGLFFKVIRSPQSSIEGARFFTALFAVPREWRAGVVVVSCHALSRPSRCLLPTPTRTDTREFLVGLHRAGDDEARLMAAKLAEAPASSGEGPRRPFLTVPGVAPFHSELMRATRGLPLIKKR